jgi:hypothetical protein
MHTLVLLLRARSEDRIAQLDRVAAVELERLRRAVDQPVIWQRSGRLAGADGPVSPWRADDTAYDAVLEHGLSNGVRLGGFDVALSVTVSDEMGPALLDAVDGETDRLGDALDATRSAVAVGPDHSILDGHGAVQLFYCMRRLPRVSHDEFSRYWLEQHSKVGVVTPGLASYHQLHADPESTARAAKLAGFGISDVDGVALEWFPDMAGFITAVGSPPSHASTAKSSESNFNDIDRATAIVGRVLEHGRTHETAP